MIQKFFVAAIVVAGLSFASHAAHAQTSEGSLPNHLFSQYLTQGGASQATAAAYPAPHPVPQHVGSSYYTYQPLMPHEMLYTHSRNYFNYYNDSSFYGGGGSLNRTTVRWQNGAAGVSALPLSNFRLQSIRYRLAKRAFSIEGPHGNADAGLIGGGIPAGSFDGSLGGCSACGN